MARRGRLGIISRLVGSPGEESHSAKGKTHEATAGQSQGGEKLRLILAVLSPPCPAQASPLQGSYQQPPRPSPENFNREGCLVGKSTIVPYRSIPHAPSCAQTLSHRCLSAPDGHLVQYIKVC